MPSSITGTQVNMFRLLRGQSGRDQQWVAIVDNWYTGEHVPITLSRGQPGRDQQWVTDNNTILDTQIYLNDTIIN
jgi:hypothetical protein